MKVLRKIIEIDDERCDGCGQCIPGCAEGALQIVDGKARMVADKFCDGLGACIGECPRGALHIVEREADAFDEAAVEQHLEDQKKMENPSQSTCQCMSTQIQQFDSGLSSLPSADDASAKQADGESALTHWPVQIRLIPPHAPFLKNADLLILADCGAVAFPALHRNLLKDKVVMMGCPKFDDPQVYIEKFIEIFRQADINSITIAVMEVPCCSGLPVMIKKSLAAADRQIPIRKITIGLRGKICADEFIG